MQVAGGFAAEAGVQRGDDVGLGHTGQRGLAPVHQQQLARGVGNAAVIHVDDAGLLLEHAAHGQRHLAPSHRFRPIDLRHQRRQHRRTRWHFDDLDVGS